MRSQGHILLDCLVAVFAGHPFPIAWGSENLGSYSQGTVVRYIVETENIPGHVEVSFELNTFERFAKEAIKE